MAAALSAITDSVHFAQTDLVNWTLVTDGSGVLLIDAGFPGSRDDVVASLRQLGFGIDDLRMVSQLAAVPGMLRFAEPESVLLVSAALLTRSRFRASSSLRSRCKVDSD